MCINTHEPPSPWNRSSALLALLYRWREFSSYTERYIFSYSSLFLSSVFSFPKSEKMCKNNMKTMTLIMIKKKCGRRQIYILAHTKIIEWKRNIYIRTFARCRSIICVWPQTFAFQLVPFRWSHATTSDIKALLLSAKALTSKWSHYLLMVKLLTRQMLRHFSLHYTSNLAFIE